MTSEDHQQRLLTAQHAMQSGVAAKMAIDPGDTTPKHLRVGINCALSGQGALAKLLIDKGMFTEEEYFKAMADAMEAEKRMYEQELSAHHGTEIHLH